MVEIVRALLEASADPNRADQYGMTPLHKVANTDTDDEGRLAERIALVRLLVQHGALIEGRHTREKKTPLIYAVQNGSVALVETLLELGADVGGRSLSTWHRVAPNATPLHHAAYHGHAAVVALLLEHGADVNDVAETELEQGSYDGCTALREALREAGTPHDDIPYDRSTSGDYPEVARLLLAAGAEVCTPTNKYISTHHCMHPDYDKPDADGRYPKTKWIDLTSLTAFEEASKQAREAYAPGSTAAQQSLASESSAASRVLRARARSLVRVGRGFNDAGLIPSEVWLAHVMPAALPTAWLAAARERS